MKIITVKELNRRRKDYDKKQQNSMVLETRRLEKAEAKLIFSFHGVAGKGRDLERWMSLEANWTVYSVLCTKCRKARYDHTMSMNGLDVYLCHACRTEFDAQWYKIRDWFNSLYPKGISMYATKEEKAKREARYKALYEAFGS